MISSIVPTTRIYAAVITLLNTMQFSTSMLIVTMEILQLTLTSAPISMLLLITRVARQKTEIMTAEAVVMAPSPPHLPWKVRTLLSAHPLTPWYGLVTSSRIATHVIS